jgi:hypothetical protein
LFCEEDKIQNVKRKNLMEDPVQGSIRVEQGIGRQMTWVSDGVYSCRENNKWHEFWMSEIAVETRRRQMCLRI